MSRVLIGRRYCTSREAYYVNNLRQASWGKHQWPHHTPMDDDPELLYYYSRLGQAKPPSHTISTGSRQVIRSGVYIAHIQVTEDTAERDTGLPLLFRGESTVKKIIVIR